jgi:hypothetical protein
VAKPRQPSPPPIVYELSLGGIRTVRFESAARYRLKDGLQTSPFKPLVGSICNNTSPLFKRPPGGHIDSFVKFNWKNSSDSDEPSISFNAAQPTSKVQQNEQLQLLEQFLHVEDTSRGIEVPLIELPDQLGSGEGLDQVGAKLWAFCKFSLLSLAAWYTGHCAASYIAEPLFCSTGLCNWRFGGLC